MDEHVPLVVAEVGEYLLRSVPGATVRWLQGRKFIVVNGKSLVEVMEKSDAE